MIPENDAAVRRSLRAGGLRITTQRRVNLECLRKTDRHPTAAWIYRRVRRRLPHVSLGTVYRNLQLLAEARLVIERSDPAGSRFDGNVSEHHHFTCVRCGRIYDLTEPADCTVQARIAGTAGFEVVGHRIEFFGRCPACPSSSATRKRTRRT